MSTKLAELLAQDEGVSLEFKQAFPEKRDLAATLCAFANTAGGELVIGVCDGRPRRVVGIPETEAIDLEQRLASIAATGISPCVIPLIRLVNIEDRCVLSARVEQGYQRPYQVTSGPEAGRTFVRIGSSTRRADAATVERLRLQSRGLSWDILPCHDLRLSDLDESQIETFLQRRFERRAIPRPEIPLARWLQKARFAADGAAGAVPTMAGILLFHPHPGEVLPQAGLEMARFRGTDADEFLDKHSADAPAWRLYDEALIFFRRHMPTHARRDVEGRTERSAYPELAFREFMINALCHRSYESGSGPVRLAIFDDIIEITNSGPLPEGLELADLGTGISVLRNPVLAKAFNELGLIEGWGTGIRQALRHLAAHLLPPAQIVEKGFFTQVSSAWRWPADLHPDEQRILELVSTSGVVTSRQVANCCDCSERTARNRLRSMSEHGLLRKTGATKGAAYVLP